MSEKNSNITWLELIALGFFIFSLMFTVRTCHRMGLEDELLEIEIKNNTELSGGIYE